MTNVAVLDIGKTNVKLALVRAGVEVEVRTTPNRMRSGPPYPHADVAAIWRFLLDGLSELGKPVTIDAITVTTHGATVALLDDDGELALPVLDYEHDGPDETGAAYERVRPSFDETGSPRLSGGLNVGAQLFWQQVRFPDRMSSVATLLSWPQYWTYRLTGVRCNEVTSLGCHTDLWSPRDGMPSRLVTEQGWLDWLPTLVSPGERIGTLRGDVATATGLDPATPVHAGIHDSNASLVRWLIEREPPFTVVSTGTWIVSLAVGAQPDELDPTRDTLLNVDAFDRPVPSGRFMGGRERELLSAALPVESEATDRATETDTVDGTPVRMPPPLASSAADTLDACSGAGPDASLVPKDRQPASDDDMVLHRVLASELMVMPSAVAGSGPFPRGAGGWSRSTHGFDRDALECAIDLYLALMTAASLDAIGAAGPSIVEGPFATNVRFRRMLAAATGRAVEAAPVGPTGTATGAARLVEMALRSGEKTGVGDERASREPARQQASDMSADDVQPDRAARELAAYARDWFERVQGDS